MSAPALVFVEQSPTVRSTSSPSRRCRSRAELGAPLEAVLIGATDAAPSAAVLQRLGTHGVAIVHLAAHPAFGAYAPAAWASAIAQAAQSVSAGAVIAAGSERGNELLAHVAARTDQPMAANCVALTPGDPG